MFQPGKYNFSVLVCLVSLVSIVYNSVCKYKTSVEGKFFDNFFVEIFSSIQIAYLLSSNNTDMIVDR